MSAYNPGGKSNDFFGKILDFAKVALPIVGLFKKAENFAACGEKFVGKSEKIL